MARNTKAQKDEAFWQLLGILLFIPFLIISVISYYSLKRKYMDQRNIQRVIDIHRLVPTFLFASLFMMSCGFIGLVFGSIVTDKFGSDIGIVFFGLVILIVLVSGYFFAQRIAVLYLSVIVDLEQNVLYFPHDMQSYSFIDYLTLKFLRESCLVDSIPLTSIIKLTRGEGKKLYIHGDFGSRAISMSSKQKRDECLSMIQALSGKKGLLIAEVEGY